MISIFNRINFLTSEKYSQKCPHLHLQADDQENISAGQSNLS